MMGAAFRSAIVLDILFNCLGAAQSGKPSRPFRGIRTYSNIAELVNRVVIGRRIEPSSNSGPAGS